MAIIARVSCGYGGSDLMMGAQRKRSEKRERVELQQSPEAADIFEKGQVDSVFVFFVFYLW